jgi:DNA invertase Pin-like site-specific DNA recombinase
MTKYGYIRVSSKDQKPERQVEALLNYGIEKENIFTDYMSGKDFNRPRYRALMRKLKRGIIKLAKERSFKT